jgi:hypothetical protein
LLFYGYKIIYLFLKTTDRIRMRIPNVFKPTVHRAPSRSIGVIVFSVTLSLCLFEFANYA